MDSAPAAPDDTTDGAHPHHRRRSSRPKLEPARFVARPSKRGIGAEDGDLAFLVGVAAGNAAGSAAGTGSNNNTVENGAVSEDMKRSGELEVDPIEEANPPGRAGAAAAAATNASRRSAELLGDAGLLLGFAQSPATKAAAAHDNTTMEDPAAPEGAKATSAAGGKRGMSRSADAGGETEEAGGGPSGKSEGTGLPDRVGSEAAAVAESEAVEQGSDDEDAAKKPEAVPSSQSSPPKAEDATDDIAAGGEGTGEKEWDEDEGGNDDHSHFSAGAPAAGLVEEEAEEEDGTWACHKCAARNPPSRARCTNCRGWKGGKRQKKAKSRGRGGAVRTKGEDGNGEPSPRRRRAKRKAPEEDGEDEEEVEFVSSSPPRNLRRSARESTPPARLQDVPLISSTVDVDSEDEEERDGEEHDGEEEGEGEEGAGGDDGALERFPFEVSDIIKKKGIRPLCQAVGCPKFSQGKNRLGFCHKHFREVREAGGGEGAPRGPASGGRASKKRWRGRRKNEEAGSPRKNEEKRPMGRPRTRPRQAGQSQCKHPGCDKYPRKGGYCLMHTSEPKNEEVEEESEEEEVEFVSSSGRPKRQSSPPKRLRDAPLAEAESPRKSVEKKPKGGTRHRQCKSPGCDKYPRGGGYCRMHTSELEEGQEPTPPQDSPERNPRGSPRKRQKLDGDTPKTYGGRPQCKSPGCEKYPQSGREGFCAAHFTEQKRKNGESPKKFVTKPQCKSPGCEKYSQTGRDGFCAAHFTEQKKLKKKNRGSKKKKASFTPLARPSSTANGGSAQSDHFPSRKNFPVGSPVVVRDRMLSRGQYLAGGVARVTHAHYAADGTAKYDVAYLLGGEETSIDGGDLADGCDLSVTNLEAERDAREDDDFSLSELDRPTPPGKVGGQRELIANADVAKGTNGGDTCWRCDQCGDLNAPNRRCSTCRNLGTNASELALLERTRYELLSGRDVWICTRCELEIPSVASPCGGCRRTISFVPLEIEEFEAFVRKQREANTEKARTWRHRQQQQQQSAEAEDGWFYREEDEVTTKQKAKKSFARLDNYKTGPHGRFFCQYAGCMAASHPNSRFCTDHTGKASSAFPVVNPKDQELVADMSDPLYLIYEQMVGTTFEDSDKHKGGHGGDRSESAMYFHTFTKSIQSHLRKCSHCPSDVKQQLRLAEEAKAAAKAKAAAEEEKSDEKAKPKKGKMGSRKKFFHRMWRRLNRES